MSVNQTKAQGLGWAEKTDAIIAEWSDADWQGFLSRYMVAQFPKVHPGGRRPRASIPARMDDDDLVLSRIIEHARAHLAADKRAKA